MNCLNKMQLIIRNESFFTHILTEINAGHKVVIPSKGNSMLPFIRPKTDEIELSPLDEKSIQKGNIVLAKTEANSYVIHRIERIEKDTITLRGDGNLNTREYCSTGQVIAEVTAIIRRNRKITKDDINWSLHRSLWFSNSLFRRLYLGTLRRLSSKI